MLIFGSIYFTLGSSSKVWNGGGEVTVHSKVVAPSPHGFCSAFLFFKKEYRRFNINTPKPEFLEWKWIEIDQLINVVVDFKRDVYKKVTSEIRKVVTN